MAAAKPYRPNGIPRIGGPHVKAYINRRPLSNAHTDLSLLVPTPILAG